MDRDLVAAVMVVADHVVHLPVLEDQYAEVAVGVGRVHRRGAASGAAVGEELHRADAQHGIAPARDITLGESFLGDAAGTAAHGHGHAHRKAARGVCRLVGLDIGPAAGRADAGIHHRTDAVGQAVPARGLDRLDQVLDPWRGHHPAQRLLRTLLQ